MSIVDDKFEEKTLQHEHAHIITHNYRKIMSIIRFNVYFRLHLLKRFNKRSIRSIRGEINDK